MCERGCRIASMKFKNKDERRLALGTTWYKLNLYFMNMTLPTSASIALCQIYTTIGNAINLQSWQTAENNIDYVQ